MKPHPVTAERISQAHQLYCTLTSQTLSLGFDRERMWYELLRLGYTLDHLHRVIRYLQREIRENRRNVGALKLSNLLQPDRFEEDLNISRVCLAPHPPPSRPAPPPPTPQAQEQGRQRALQYLRQLKSQLERRPTTQTQKTNPPQSAKTCSLPTDEIAKSPTG